MVDSSTRGFWRPAHVPGNRQKVKTSASPWWISVTTIYFIIILETPLVNYVLYIYWYSFAQRRIKHFTTLQTGTWHTFLSTLVEYRGDGSYSLGATLEPPCLPVLHARYGRRLRSQSGASKGYASWLESKMLRAQDVIQHNMWHLHSFSPAVQILPGPAGDFLLSRSARSRLPTFSLKVSRGQNASMSIARKK
jgi:hypothetical protein